MLCRTTTIIYTASYSTGPLVFPNSFLSRFQFPNFIPRPALSLSLLKSYPINPSYPRFVAKRVMCAAVLIHSSARGRTRTLYTKPENDVLIYFNSLGDFFFIRLTRKKKIIQCSRRFWQRYISRFSKWYFKFYTRDG